MRVWSKDSIQALLKTNNGAVIKAMFAIQDRQTHEEQVSHQTRETNGVGWSKFDAEWMGEMIKKYNQYGSLTPKQMAVTRNKILRYHRQLVEIANDNEAKKAAAAALSAPTIESTDYPDELDGREIDLAMKAAFQQSEVEAEARAAMSKYAGQFA